MFRGDAIECLRALPDGSVNLIVTDFPYESLEKHRKKGTTTRLKKSKSSSNEWFEIFPNDRIPELLHELYRVLAPNSHCYLFCDDETSDILRTVVNAMRAERGKKDSFHWWKRIVWDKVLRGMGYHYAAQYEFIVFLEKGKRNLNTRKLRDILSVSRVTKKSLGGRDPMPTEKPVELLAKLIANSSDKGDLVVDAFAGSGSTGVAALGLGREFLGFELAPHKARFARKRLRAAEGR